MLINDGVTCLWKTDVLTVMNLVETKYKYNFHSETKEILEENLKHLLMRDMKLQCSGHPNALISSR